MEIMTIVFTFFFFNNCSKIGPLLMLPTAVLWVSHYGPEGGYRKSEKFKHDHYNNKITRLYHTTRDIVICLRLCCLTTAVTTRFSRNVDNFSGSTIF